MSSESGQRLPMEELKRRNASQPVPTQTCPSQEEWENLLLMISALYQLTTEQSKALENLERHTAAHTALLREASSQREPYPTQAQMEALARDVAEIRAILRQAGKRNEKRFSLPGIRLPRLRLPDIPWSSLLLGLAALALTGLVLWVVWSSLDTLWSAAKTMLLLCSICVAHTAYNLVLLRQFLLAQIIAVEVALVVTRPGCAAQTEFVMLRLCNITVDAVIFCNFSSVMPAVGIHSSQASQWAVLPHGIYEFLQALLEFQCIEPILVVGPPGVVEAIPAGTEIHSEMAHGTERLVLFLIRIEQTRLLYGSGP